VPSPATKAREEDTGRTAELSKGKNSPKHNAKKAIRLNRLISETDFSKRGIDPSSKPKIPYYV
jgi:hypothetical protein